MVHGVAGATCGRAHDITRSRVRRGPRRIAAYDKNGPYINALMTVNAQALEEADTLHTASTASGTFIGPLHGFPVIVKDNLDAVGMPMSWGILWNRWPGLLTCWPSVAKHCKTV